MSAGASDALEQLIGRALDGVLAPQLDNLVERVALRVVEKLEQRAEPLKTLPQIIGGTAARCREVERRHPELLKLARTLGSRRLYERAAVEQWMRERAPRLRAVGGDE